MANYYKVTSSYMSVLEDGKTGTKKETFLIECSNFAEAYYTIVEILNQTTEEKDSIKIHRIDWLDKLNKLYVSDLLGKEESLKKGMIELSCDKDVRLYHIKMMFTIFDGGKEKKTYDIYYVPAEDTTHAIKHLNVSVADSPFDHEVVDTKQMSIDTILLPEDTYEQLTREYDILKPKL